MVYPTTAATLRATSRTVRRPWPWRWMSDALTSEAQRVAYRFGFLALILVVMIGGLEWTRTFISAVVSDQAEHTKVLEELRPGRAAQKRLAEQIALVDRDRPGGAEQLRAGLVRQTRRARHPPAAPGRPRGRPGPAHPGRLRDARPHPAGGQLERAAQRDRAGGHDRGGAGAAGALRRAGHGHLRPAHGLRRDDPAQLRCPAHRRVRGAHLPGHAERREPAVADGRATARASPAASRRRCWPSSGATASSCSSRRSTACS